MAITSGQYMHAWPHDNQNVAVEAVAASDNSMGHFEVVVSDDTMGHIEVVACHTQSALCVDSVGLEEDEAGIGEEEDEEGGIGDDSEAAET